jgi:C1A family cysteine protease
MDSVKRALLCHGPLAAGSDTQVHDFLIVGWNNTMTFPDWNTTGGWIRKNSWGLGYGTKGYGNLPYDHPFTDFINDTYWVEV